jgi:signal transduction histidine kinase
LAIAHNIIQAHGGKISVESEGGQGAAFTVLIPLLNKEADDER